MPYKSESIPIAGIKLDQRRKLSDEQHPTEHWTKKRECCKRKQYLYLEGKLKTKKHTNK